MINLLPEKAKKELELGKTAKKISALLFFALIALGFLAIVLSFIKLSILAQIETVKALSSEQEQLLESAQFQDFKQTITHANQNLAKIEKFYKNQISVADILKNISIYQQTGISNSIYLTSFSFKKVYQQEKEKEIKIWADVNVDGWANDRESLFLFKGGLEKIVAFQEIYFSPRSWTNPENIDFSFSFKTMIK